MIFTECECGNSIIYPYESGQSPCGFNVYGIVRCEKCNELVAVERSSICGEAKMFKDIEKTHVIFAIPLKPKEAL